VRRFTHAQVPLRHHREIREIYSESSRGTTPIVSIMISNALIAVMFENSYHRIYLHYE
jgi:hypothetical protein